MTIGEEASRWRAATTADHRYAELDAFLEKTARRAAGLLARRAVALRQVLRLPAGLPVVLLPAVHRRQESAQAIDTSATLKGNFAWHITRAFHLAGRCVGCDECTRACPAGIDLRLLNLSLAQAAEEHFAFAPASIPRPSRDRRLRGTGQGELHPMSEILSLRPSATGRPLDWRGPPRGRAARVNELVLYGR